MENIKKAIERMKDIENIETSSNESFCNIKVLFKNKAEMNIIKINDYDFYSFIAIEKNYCDYLLNKKKVKFTESEIIDIAKKIKGYC